MADKSLKNKTISGFIWSFCDLSVNQGLQFVIQIVLARLLSPKDFGLIGMITVFIALSKFLIDSGLSNALIREKEVTYEDYSTIFYFNIITAVTIYIMLYLCAPFIAHFFNEIALCRILRILSITIIINSFSLMQQIMLIRKIDFKSQMKINVFASVLSGIIGIIAAMNNFGVYSLVIRTLSMDAVTAFLLFLDNRWLPKAVFSKKRFIHFFKYGWKMVAAGMIDTLYTNLYYVIIGKQYSAVSLGYYTNACKIKDTVSQSLTGAVQKVSYPVLSRLNSADADMKIPYKKLIKNTAFIVFPVMMGIGVCSEGIINVILGNKWLGSVIFLELLCIEAMFYPINAVNLNILQVKGRSDLFLKLELIKKFIACTVIAVIIMLKGSVFILLICAVITSLGDYIINSYYSKDLIGYSLGEQLKDLKQIFLMTVLMGIITYLTGCFIYNKILKLSIQVLTGVIIYIAEGILIKNEEFINLYSIAKDYFSSLLKCIRY